MSKRLGWLIPLLFCVGGLVMAHHPMMKNGLGWIQFDPGDTRFCNYLLEHDYRWMLRQPNHTELWSPPYFFPSHGHLAWAENMLGAMPAYALWRVLGFPIDTAFQLWILSMGALNFVAMFFFLRRAAQVDTFAASVGAVLFAFAGMRVNQSMHYQLFPQFFSVWAVHACWRLAVDGKQLTAQQRTRWLGLLFFAVVAQISVGIYLGWFLIFGLATAGGLALLFKSGRERIGFVLKSHPFTIGLFSVASIAALLPIGVRYLGTADQFGGRPFTEAMTMIPPPQAWFHLGIFSWFYGWTEYWPIFQAIPMEYEQRIGYGLVTTALCVAGLWKVRHDQGLRFLGLLLLLLILCTTVFGTYPNGVTAWKAVWTYFPGAKAIRGVARIAMLYLIAVALFVAIALNRLRARGGKLALLAFPLGMFSVIEQGETTVAFDKYQARRDVKDIAAAVGPECEAFLFSPVDGSGPYWKYQLDAMMASLDRGLPTLNGYSGQNPPGWGLGDPAIRGPGDEQNVSAQAQAWISQQQVEQKVCWAKVALQEGPLQAEFISQHVPTELTAGQRAAVQLRFRNLGKLPWDPAQGFRLGSQAPRDNLTWGTARVEIPKVVKVGEDLEVSFEVTAPTQPGKYSFQWRLLQERVRWFGAPTPLLEVEVTGPSTDSKDDAH